MDQPSQVYFPEHFNEINRPADQKRVSKISKDKIEAQGFEIQVYTQDFKNDYFSLTDMAKYRNSDDPRYVIQNWMRNRNTLEYIGLWEFLNNQNFNRVEFDAV